MTVSEERIAALEARTAGLEMRMARLDATRGALRSNSDLKAPRASEARLRASQPGAADTTAGAARAAAARAADTTAGAARAGASAADTGAAGAADGATAARPAGPAPRTAPALEDLVGGRVLGWVGAVAVLVGLLLLLLIAASRGWIGEEARTLMAAATSLALVAGGARLHERRGRTEAALAAAAAGIAGLFATTVVAGAVYELIPTTAALALALAAGAAATALALRWAAPGIGWLGILGAIGSPALVGAAGDGAGIAFLLVAYAAAGAVMIWQRWHALAGAAFAIAVPQLGDWLLGGPPAAGTVTALTAFGAVTAVAAAGFEWRLRAPAVRVSALVLLALNALALATLGVLGLWELGLDAGAGNAWLAGLAAAHLAAAALARQSPRISRELALTLAALGIVLADVAFASIADGLPLVLGWAAGAVGFAALARVARHDVDEAAAFGGLGGHLLLAVATALTGVAPLAAMSGGSPDRAAALAALAALTTGAWAAARLVVERRPEARLVLDASALAGLVLFSAVALDGVALTLALAGEAVALATLARREHRRATAGGDPLAFPAALAFLGVALSHALATLAPATALVTGLDPVLPALAGLGALVAASALVARAAADPRLRLALQSAAAVLALYLASTLLVTPFQPGGDATGLPLDRLDIRQQGQALLSALWALAGVAALIAGLVRDDRALRLGALALLSLTAGKVFAFDLASLTSLYRVGSCIALGLLLLVGAFAWQRIRPRPPGDLRGMPSALR
jgi:uncharacterized membrane protein